MLRLYLCCPCACTRLHAPARAVVSLVFLSVPCRISFFFFSYLLQRAVACQRAVVSFSLLCHGTPPLLAQQAACSDVRCGAPSPPPLRHLPRSPESSLVVAECADVDRIYPPINNKAQAAAPAARRGTEVAGESTAELNGMIASLQEKVRVLEAEITAANASADAEQQRKEAEEEARERETVTKAGLVASLQTDMKEMVGTSSVPLLLV